MKPKVTRCCSYIFIHKENDKTSKYKVVLRKELNNNKVCRKIYQFNDYKAAKNMLKNIKKEYKCLTKQF